MALVDFFASRTSRTFHVNDSERTASHTVGTMTLADGAPSGLPPGVFGTRRGPGHFQAASPVALFDSTFETRSDGGRGSWVTERKTAFSPIPGMAYLADAIHDFATDPEAAYHRAAARKGGRG